MSDHVVFSEEMREIVESFVLETQDILDELNADLLLLEKAEDPALVDRVFRAVHTVKGTSSFLNLDQLNALTHHFEEVLNLLRKGRLAFRPEMMDVLFDAFDQMAALLQQVLDRHITPLPIEDLLSKLSDLSSSGSSGDGAAGEPELARDLVDRPSVAPSSVRATSVRVDIQRLDSLMMLVSELTASRNALTRIVGDLESAYGPLPQICDLHDNTDRLDAVTSEIRTVVMTTRMVAIERIFGKFPRVARDLGRSLGKDIRIECHGSDTLIDRCIADDIGEALLHLIRNAIDHGIEPKDERLAAGKPALGTIALSAASDDTHVLISVHDDGHGLDPVAIRRKAVDHGVLTEREADEMPDAGVFALIWEAGFSTTSVANHVSGRGVGLDIVRAGIESAGGSIETTSVPGDGTCFTLRLPKGAAPSA